MYHDLVRTTGALNELYTRAGSERLTEEAGKRAMLERWGEERAIFGSGNVARGGFESLICTPARCNWSSKLLTT